MQPQCCILRMNYDIYSSKGLKQIDEAFLKFSQENPGNLIHSSRLLEQFLATIFPIQQFLDAHYKEASDQKILYEFKRQFIQRRAVRKYAKEDVKLTDCAQWDKMDPLELACLVLSLLKDEAINKEELDKLMRYAAYKAYFDPSHPVFQLPQKLDFENLLTGYKPKDPHDQANYCIYCAGQNKDSCRTGLPEQTNPLGNKLTGCPLGQKVSEMNYLYSEGHILASIAVAMIDNPLVAATGSRVCNDCVKSCIFQKQDQVDTPTIESQIVRSVLALPYGAEIYYLLTRWNPLDNYMAKENSPGMALVTGMGPAGFAMAYYLLREGHSVTGIDALEIDQLPQEFLKPIHNWQETVGTYEPQGFGGVAEYGITDRWDKTNLLLIRMVLERFKNFELIGSTRLGQDKTIAAALEEFNYIALCLGAGKPYVPEVKNIDAKGVYSAFDFLMDVNLGKPVDLGPPVVVLGGGLTSIDCCLEAIKLCPDVSILYRKSINASPSYRENHDELQIALSKGVKFIENTNLDEIAVDENGHIKSVNNIPARSLIYAIGTNYNDEIIKAEEAIVKANSSRIGIFGDLDPTYIGSVVKAIASSKNGYKKVSAIISGINSQ